MQVMMSMQKIFYQNCEIYGACDSWGSDLKLGQIDRIMEIFQILEHLLHYSRLYLRKTKCITMIF